MWLFQIIHVDSSFNWHVVGWKKIPLNRVGSKLCPKKKGEKERTTKNQKIIPINEELYGPNHCYIFWLKNKRPHHLKIIIEQNSLWKYKN